MLYVSTKDRNQTYTAYQALHLPDADLDGRIVPLRVPVFSVKEICGGSFCQTVAKILNKFFSTNVSAQDIEACLKKHPLLSDTLDRKTLLIRLGVRSESGAYYLVDHIYRLLSGKNTNAPTLPKMLIQISLLFGLYGDLLRCGISKIDIAVCANGFWGLDSVCFAQKMGLPVRLMICGCATEDRIWGLVRKGTLSSFDADASAVLYARSSLEAERYNHCCQAKEVYVLPEEQLASLNSDIFTAVVSSERHHDVISNVYSTYGKKLSLDAACAYGALQDYRAVSGENRITVVFSEDL